MESILYVWLPSEKIYPGGPVYLADYVHKQAPEVEQNIIDLSLVEKKRRMGYLHEKVEEFDPSVVAFSWKNIQIFSPKQEDRSLEMAFKFYYSKNPLDKIQAGIHGIKSVLMYTTRIQELIRYINSVKDRKVVVGGAAFGLFADRLIHKLNEGILGVIGEGEGVMLKVASGRWGKELLDERVVFRHGKDIFLGDQKEYVDIGSLAPVDFEYIEKIFPDFKEYLDCYIGVQTKRGCPFRCIFCSYPFIEGKRLRYRSPETVVSEIEALKENYGVRKIWFTDSQFISAPRTIAHCNAVLEGIIQKGLDIQWGGYVRIDQIDERLAKNLVDSGIIHFELSITSGSQKLVDFMKMGYKLEKVVEACRLIKRAGYDGHEVILNYSFNVPNETEETLLESVETYKKIRDIFGFDNVLPYIFFLGIQPHTELERYAIETGHISHNYDPLAINPRTAKKLIYNPAPFNKFLARLYLDVLRDAKTTGERERAGIRFLEEMEERLVKEQ
ncbi:MAG: B12-binding domain-containing radical SAM protein [Candidatus Hydrothermarchaeales archaeon]